MLTTLLMEGYGEQEDFNCAEKILYGANQAYHLNLDENFLKMSAGFGGGMAIENVCGTLTASIMVLGLLFVKKNAHESTKIKDLTQELLNTYQQEMGDIDCGPLKANHRTEEIKCKNVILKAAQILDKIIKKETSCCN